MQVVPYSSVGRFSSRLNSAACQPAHRVLRIRGVKGKGSADALRRKNARLREKIKEVLNKHLEIQEVAGEIPLR